MARRTGDSREASRVLVQIIRHHRHAARLSQEKLAAEMTAEGFRWYQSTVNKVETELRIVNWDEAVALASILEFDLAEAVNAIIWTP